ncbi:hypothetical protein BGM24_25140 [Bacillus sp. FJAT-26377]|nr:hypothetical protein [Bacillus sp. FJAT-26377]
MTKSREILKRLIRLIGQITRFIAKRHIFMAFLISLSCIIIVSLFTLLIAMTIDSGFEDNVYEEKHLKGLIVDKKINVWTEHEMDYFVSPLMLGNSSSGLILTPNFQSEEKMELTLRVYAEGETLTLVVDEDVYHSYKQGDKVLLRLKNNYVEIKGE